MPDRRNFLAGGLAASLCPRLSWADAGNPAYLAAAQGADGRHVLVGLDAAGQERFSLKLPARGHAAAAHPRRPEATAFARRPGTFALVVDCIDGRIRAVLDAPEGRHFYGHGAYSADGRLLFTPENDYANARGVVGIWDAEAGYLRVGEFASHGIGPHDILLMQDGATLAVANGGIETRPDTGRAKLNIPFMRPNLAYVTLDGALLDSVEPPEEWRQNSIRHLALGPDGTIAFAMQWQGDAARHPPLLGLHRRDSAPLFLAAPEAAHRRMDNYAGSVAIAGDGRHVAISSPRGGLVQIFDIAAQGYAGAVDCADVCGLAPGRDGLIATSGTGGIVALRGTERLWQSSHRLHWDNHLVTVGGARV